MKSKLHPLEFVHCITIASTNGQTLPHELINLALSLELKKVDLESNINLGAALLQRNQELPKTFIGSVLASAQRYAGESRMPEAGIVSAMIQHNHPIQAPVIEAFATYLLQTTNEANPNLEYLSALIRVLETRELHEELKETIRSALTSVVDTSPSRVYQALAQDGLEKHFVGGSVPLTSDLICPECDDKHLLEWIIGRIQCAYGDIPEDYQPLNTITKVGLKTHFALHKKVPITDVSEVLLKVFVLYEKQPALFSELTDVVCYVLCETESPIVFQNCRNVLDIWIKAGVVLGSGCREMLELSCSPLAKCLWNEEILSRDNDIRLGIQLVMAARNFVETITVSGFDGLAELLNSPNIDEPECRAHICEMVRILLETEGTTWTSIPNVVQAAAIYVAESGPGEVPEALATLIEGFITESSGENFPPVVQVYLKGIVEQKIVLKSVKAISIIVTTYLEQLPWPQVVQTLNILLSSEFTQDKGRLLVISLDNKSAPIRSAAYALIRANRESIKKFQDLEDVIMERTTNDLQKVYHEIYGDDPVPQDDGNFDQELLHTFYSLLNWDTSKLQQTTDRSQWFRLLTVSDFVTRLSTSIDDTIELAMSGAKIFEKCKRDPQVFASLTELICTTDSKHMLPLLEQLTQNEVVDTTQMVPRTWSKEVLIMGLSSLLARKCETLSPKSASCFVKKLVRTLDSCPELSRDLVLNMSTIENTCVLEELLEVLDFGMKNKRSGLVRSLKQILNQNSGFCDPDISAMDLKIMVEKKLFLEHVPKSAAGYNIEDLEEILGTLFRKGFKLQQLLELLLINPEDDPHKPTKHPDRFSPNQPEAVYHVLYHLVEYSMEKSIIPEIMTNIKSVPYSQWAREASKTCLRSLYRGSRGVRTVGEVVNEFGKLNPSMATNEIERIIDSIRSNTSEVSSWDETKIRKWAKNLKKRPQAERDETLEKVLAVSNRAFTLQRGYELTAIQVLACLTALKTSNKRMLQQVATGAGKSTIIAIIALIKALSGTKVDIFCSTPVLAEKEAINWSNFYNMFDVECDHNADSSFGYTKGKKSCYEKDIVYGEMTQFQFDALRDGYSGLTTRAERLYGFAIVDEVDCILIDDSTKLAQLTSSIPGMELVQPLYHLAWQRLLDIKARIVSVRGSVCYLGGINLLGSASSFSDGEENNVKRDLVQYLLNNASDPAELEKNNVQIIQNVHEFVSSHLEEYLHSLIEKNDGREALVHLPPNIHAFATHQIKNWVESALTASTFQENVHYIVDNGLIKPVDFATTGIVQPCSSWTNGLHQFLQIKHSLRVTTETVTTNFLSNISMLNKYGTCLLGFTGTLLGSKSEEHPNPQSHWSVLKSIYNVQTVIIPELYFKRFHKLVPQIIDTQDRWESKIVTSCLTETASSRGVLVICQTIRQCLLLEAKLRKRNLNVKLYTRNDQNQEFLVERIRPGDVTVATNLAGRLTDINTAGVEESGGMHVILTFLPDSSRVEEQGFGQTSRQGSSGTGQMIMVADEWAPTTPIKDLVEQRNQRERAGLEELSKNQLPMMEVKAELLEKFTECYVKLKGKLKQSPIERPLSGFVTFGKKLLNMETLTPLEATVMQVVEELWAKFLKSIDEEPLDNLQGANEDKESLHRATEKLIESFLNGTQDNDGKTPWYETLIASTKNPFYWIQFGNEYFRRYKLPTQVSDHYKKVAQYYDKAIEMDRSSAAGAIAGISNLLLRGERCWYSSLIKASKGYTTNYKLEAIRLSREAVKLLYQEIGVQASIQSLLTRRNQNNKDSELFLQLNTKANLLGTYLQRLESNIISIQKSLRRVYYRGRTEDCSVDSTVLVQDNSIPDSDEYASYDLMFHDLTLRKDLPGVGNDQALMTIKNNSSLLDSSPLSGVNVRVRLEKIGLQNFLKAVGKICPQEYKFKLELYSLPDIKTCEEVLTKFQAGTDFHVIISGGVKDLEPFYNNILRNSRLTAHIKYQELTTDLDPFPSSKKILIKNADEEGDFASAKSQIPKHITYLDVIVGAPPDGDIKAFMEHKDDEDRLSFSVIASGLSPSSLGECCESCFHVSDDSAFSLPLMQDNYEEIVQALRKEKLEFVLEFTNLKTLEKVRTCLESAAMKEEDMEKKKKWRMEDEFSSDRLPLEELRELSQRGIDLLVTFGERNFIPWKSVILMGIVATTQVTVGNILVCTGCAPLGLVLEWQGFKDLKFTAGAFTKRDFDWSVYAKQKAVSLVISAVSIGFSGLATATEGIQQAGLTQKLESLAAQELGTGLTFILTTIIKFSFSQLRDSISELVEKNFAEAFKAKDLEHHLRRLYALSPLLKDPQELHDKIQTWVRETTDPKWKSNWNSIWVPLVDGILSDENCLTGFYRLGRRAIDVIKGNDDIKNMSSAVCDYLEEKIKGGAETTTVAQIIRRHTDLTPVEAERAGKCIKFEDFEKTLKVKEFLFDNPSTSFEQSPEDKNIQSKAKDEIEKLFNSLFQKERNFDPDCMSKVRKSITDAITQYVIDVANSALQSRKVTNAFPSMVTSRAKKLQAQACLREFGLDSCSADSTPQVQDELQSVPGRKEAPSSTSSIANQPTALRDKVEELPYNTRGDKNPHKNVPEQILQTPLNVPDTGPGDISTVFLLGRLNGLNLKLFYGPPNPALKKTKFPAGVRVVLCYLEEDENDSGFSYFKILERGTTEEEETHLGSFAILETLTGKSEQELRLQLANFIRHNPERYEEIRETNIWTYRNGPPPDR